MNNTLHCEHELAPMVIVLPWEPPCLAPRVSPLASAPAAAYDALPHWLRPTTANGGTQLKHVRSGRFMHPLRIRPPPSTCPAVSKRRHVTYAALQGEVGEPVSGLSFSHSCVEICQKREKTNNGLGPLGVGGVNGAAAWLRLPSFCPSLGLLRVNNGH